MAEVTGINSMAKVIRINGKGNWSQWKRYWYNGKGKYIPSYNASIVSATVVFTDLNNPK